jgi:hypothetical protein
VNNKETVGSEDLLVLMKNLSYGEYHMGEECSILEKMKALDYMSKEISEVYGVDFGDDSSSYKSIFGSIIIDE